MQIIDWKKIIVAILDKKALINDVIMLNLDKKMSIHLTYKSQIV